VDWIKVLSIIGSLMKSYNNTLKRGCRIALRAKVNDSLITGLRVVDSILPVGRGQRQLILGDRYTGKTSIFLSLLITLNRLNFFFYSNASFSFAPIPRHRSILILSILLYSIFSLITKIINPLFLLLFF